MKRRRAWRRLFRLCHRPTPAVGKKVAVLFGYVAKCQYLCKQVRNSVMRSSQEYIDIIREHSSELREQFGITSMRLFGSVARNEHHEGSDVDLFVTMPPKFFNHVLAAQYLEELLECTIDFVKDQKNLRPFFKEQIEQYGINIFTAS